MTACGRSQRRLVLGLTGLLVGLAACSTPGAAPQPSPTTAAPDATASAPPAWVPAAPPSAAAPSSPAPSEPPCAALVARMSRSERVGQLLMVAVTSTGVTAQQRAAVTDTAAGSVILLGNSTAGTDSVGDVVARARAASVRPVGVRLLVAADQEGGRVQRLRGPGFDTIPSAVQQAELSDDELTERARTWGAQLDAAGVDANLAPVADVVPAELRRLNQPVGQLRRGYGSAPGSVAAKVAAFTTGMGDAGVATAVKHFPGLGRVRGNTDTTRDVVDRSTTRDDPGLQGFRAAVGAGVDMVMVSSATYARVDETRRAVFSPVVIGGMIRDDLGFDGVVISDDLAAVALRDVPAGERVVRFVRAGGDLAIVGSAAEAQLMATALRDRARSDPDFAARVDAAAGRVLRLKQRRGLADC